MNKINVTFQELKKRHLYRLTVILLFLAFTIVAFLVSCSLGAYKATFGEVIRAIFVEKEGIAWRIIWNVRVSRTLVAACVGTCLALSGCILQGVMRNPLASPNIIGVSSGAGFGAVLVLVLLPNLEYLLVPVAFAFGLITTIIIYLLSWKNGIQPLRMILAGIAISSFLGALNNLILIFFPDRVQNTLGFMMGSLAARTWFHFHLIWPYTLVGLIICIIFAQRLNILMLGDEMAIGLGLNVERTRMFFIALAALLAATSVSIVGILGFVGLLVPHIVRMLLGSDYRYLFIGSGIFGAGLVMSCDTLARTVLQPIEIPVGIVMAIIGTPFFIYLLRNRKRIYD